MTYFAAGFTISLSTFVLAGVICALAVLGLLISAHVWLRRAYQREVYKLVNDYCRRLDTVDMRLKQLQDDYGETEEKLFLKQAKQEFYLGYEALASIKIPTHGLTEQLLERLEATLTYCQKQLDRARWVQVGIPFNDKEVTMGS